MREKSGRPGQSGDVIGHGLIAVHSTRHEQFNIIVHSQLVLVKFFEAAGLAQPHTKDRASK